MDFELGQKVKVKVGKLGGVAGKGIIQLLMYQNNVIGGTKQIQVRIDGGNNAFNYTEEDVLELKTQTLHAYKDATDEVHWSTRKYDGKERTNFGFVEAFEFNKTIDLE